MTKLKINEWIKLSKEKNDLLGNIGLLEITYRSAESGCILKESTEDSNTYRITAKTLRELSKACEIMANEIEMEEVKVDLEKSQAW